MAATLEDEDFHYLINCILNAILCFTASTLNGITIYALRKASSLPKSLRTLLLSLAVSDVGVGFLAQPLYSALLGVAFQGKKNTPNYEKMFSGFMTTVHLFSAASYTGIVILALDRFLAIHLHLRYRELVTQRRVVAVVILNWVSAALLASMELLNLTDISDGYYSFLAISGNIITPILYCKIYSTTTRHASQIRAIQVDATQQSGQVGDAVRLRKSITGTFLVYLAFLLCYLPSLTTRFVILIAGASDTRRLCQIYAITMIYLNSSLNPLIYCWKVRQIRRTVVEMLSASVLRCRRLEIRQTAKHSRKRSLELPVPSRLDRRQEEPRF
ncbi:adenosine receptor A3-like isoform X1 [Acropora millepora]|uniref:adenosine receptor A3-like isoform X1 n=1 Tax=Acropora millepora TaxID=45264 RepID=UPI001CF368C9|nr:adenosine receptor A3-like isoform X1 [Acropora millepora]